MAVASPTTRSLPSRPDQSPEPSPSDPNNHTLAGHRIFSWGTKLTLTSSSLCNSVKEVLRFFYSRKLLGSFVMKSAEPSTSPLVRGAGLFDRIDYRLIETREDKDLI